MGHDGGSYGSSDNMDLYDGRHRKRRNNYKERQRQRNQNINNEIMQPQPSCWSSIFYCGGDNDKQIANDINEDNRFNNNNNNGGGGYSPIDTMNTMDTMDTADTYGSFDSQINDNYHHQLSPQSNRKNNSREKKKNK